MEDNITLINNTGYGATELKGTYRRSIREGMLIAVLLHLALVFGYILFTYISNANAEEKKIPLKKPIIIVDLDKLESNEDVEQPKVKPDEITKPEKDLSALQPKPVAKEIADDVKLKTQSELDNIKNNVSSNGDSLKYIADNSNKNIDENKIDNKIKDVIKDNTKNTEFQGLQVDVMPECTNLQQVRSQIQYPKLAVDAGIEGRVTVKVLVGADGNVLKVGSISGNEVFHEEVKEKSRGLIFTPGLMNNQAVKVWVTVPFSFKLKN